MARPAERFVRTLTDSEKERLGSIWKSGESHRTRLRAHAILLSNSGRTVSDLAEIFQVTMQTVYSWIERWESDQDLDDAPRSGAPPKLSAEEEEIAIEELKKSPHNPQGAIDNIRRRTSKQISQELLCRLAKANGLVWKRMRGSLRDRRDDEAFLQAKEEIRELAQLHSGNELNLWFFDEAAFSLQPPIPYAWQPIGETIEIPYQRGPSISAMGFLDLENHFHPYEFEGTINSELVIGVMDHFADKVSGNNVVVLDNAPVHHSKALKERIDGWRERGVELYFLPPYSPELNLIEILWRNLKQHWLPLRAYRTLSNLWDELGEAMASVGKRYKIELSAIQLD